MYASVGEDDVYESAFPVVAHRQGGLKERNQTFSFKSLFRLKAGYKEAGFCEKEWQCLWFQFQKYQVFSISGQVWHQIHGKDDSLQQVKL